MKVNELIDLINNFNQDAIPLVALRKLQECLSDKLTLVCGAIEEKKLNEKDTD